MIHDIESIIHYRMTCAKCGQKFAASVSLLKTSTSIPCSHCGTVVDLTDPKRRADIDEFAKTAASVMPRPEDFVKKR